MSDGDPTPSAPPRPTVFLSYASEDREAAKLIRDALPELGLEAWYDESALEGGDAWDQKIRRQIRDCDFFMPIVSAQTEARLEGYFRREWRLAVERTLDMADDHIFLLPVVIDDTSDTGARVPERFLHVQWTRMPGGKPTPGFEAMCRRLSSGDPSALQTPPKAASSVRAFRRRAERPPPPPLPEFPQYDAAKKGAFAGQSALWGARSLWALFMRLPKVVRIVAYIWFFGVLLNRGCALVSPEKDEERISTAQKQQLQQIAEKYRGASRQPGGPDLTKLAEEIAKTFPETDEAAAAGNGALLAVPFTAPTGDAAAKNLADSAFVQVYGRVAISHRGKVSLPSGALPSEDLAGAVTRGREQHAKYVLYGAIETPPGAATLNIQLVTVADSSVVWSKSYPVAGADAAQIAAEVDSKVPTLEKD